MRMGKKERNKGMKVGRKKKNRYERREQGGECDVVGKLNHHSVWF